MSRFPKITFPYLPAGYTDVELEPSGDYTSASWDVRMRAYARDAAQWLFESVPSRFLDELRAEIARLETLED